MLNDIENEELFKVLQTADKLNLQIARREGVDNSGVCEVIQRGLINLRKLLDGQF